MIQRHDVNQTPDKSEDTVAVSDRGLAYGDGLFETIAFVNGALNHWELHWQRLKSGADRLVINLPEEQYFLEQINIKNSLCNALHPDRVIKIIVTRGQGGRGYLYPEPQKPTIIITVHTWPERAVEDYHSGIRVTICQTCLAKQPALAGIKHLNRLEQVLGRNEFSAGQYQEGIMLACSDKPSDISTNISLNMNSLMIEGTSSNLFFVINDRLLTPKIDTCGVLGTIRQAVIVLAKQLGIEVEENHYALSELGNASEVFFTNSLFGILPVAAITVSDDLQWCYGLQDSLQNGLHERNISSTLAMTINKALNRPITQDKLE